MQSPQDSDALIAPLLQKVPGAASRILDVGCGDGQLGARLKEMGAASRQVFGMESDPAAATAARRLDLVFPLDSEPELEAHSLDCILFGDVLERTADPLALIRRLRPLLRPDGVMLCRVKNAQYFPVMASLFTNDFQTRDHPRLFTLSSLYKLLLDADLLPNLAHALISPCSDEFLQAALPLATHFRIESEVIHQRLSTMQYVVQAFPLPEIDQPDEPMSFVACCNDELQLANNLAASPCFRDGRHELLVYRNQASAAEGINAGLEQARHRFVVAVHQDIYIPDGWPARFQAQWRAAEAKFGPLGLAGVFGVASQSGGVRRTGLILDRGRLIHSGHALPAVAISLDEVVLAFPKNTKVRLDPAIGWHCYGTDAALQTGANGLATAILDAPCLHNSRFSGLGADFVASAKVLADKWREPRPLYTTCVRVDDKGGLSGW
jgi:SAM-dependent methyltransferase